MNSGQTFQRVRKGELLCFISSRYWQRCWHLLFAFYTASFNRTHTFPRNYHLITSDLNTALNFSLRIPFNSFPNRRKSQPTLWFQCISTNRSWSLLITHNDVILFLYDVRTITIHHIWSSAKLKDSVFQFLINSKWLKYYCITSPGRHEPTQIGHWQRSETWNQWVYWSYSHERGVTCRSRVTPRQIHPQSPLSTGDSSKKLHPLTLTGLWGALRGPA